MLIEVIIAGLIVAGAIIWWIFDQKKVRAQIAADAAEALELVALEAAKVEDAARALKKKLADKKIADEAKEAEAIEAVAKAFRERVIQHTVHFRKGKHAKKKYQEPHY